MTHENLTIVIVNYKSVSFLERCIKSIKAETLHDHQIIVIDNNSGTQEVKKLKTLPLDRLILNYQNKGFAAANNQGFKMAKGKYVLMLNPDTYVINGAIDQMIACLESNSQFHAVAPKLYHSELLDHHPSVHQFPNPTRDIIPYLPLSSTLFSLIPKFPYSKRDINKTQKIDYACGAAILFKKTVFDRVGFLDESFFVYSEEVDLCKRMALTDLNLCYFPKAEIIHYGGKSQLNSSIPKHTLYWKSKMIYYEKYFPNFYIRANSLLFCFIIFFKIFVLKQRKLRPVFNVLKEKLLGHQFLPRH